MLTHPLLTISNQVKCEALNAAITARKPHAVSRLLEHISGNVLIFATINNDPQLVHTLLNNSLLTFSVKEKVRAFKLSAYLPELRMLGVFLALIGNTITMHDKEIALVIAVKGNQPENVQLILGQLGLVALSPILKDRLLGWAVHIRGFYLDDKSLEIVKRI